MKKNGFTLIETLITISIMGILVLLASLLFLRHTHEALEVHIKADIKVLENLIDSKILYEDKLTKEWSNGERQKIEELIKTSKFYDKKGLIKDPESLKSSKFKIVVNKDINFDTRLNGVFLYGENSEVYYYDSSDLNDLKQKDENGEPKDDDRSGSSTSIEDDKDKTDPSLPPEEDVNSSSEKEKEFTPESDFKWVRDSGGYYSSYQGETGYYSYIGEAGKVVVPETLYGEKITSYHKMFYGVGATVEKVVSYNEDVTDMSYMFAYTLAQNLDLTELESSNVETMQQMFYNSTTKTLDLSNLNTSRVKSMYYMFMGSTAGKLDLRSFDTSNVEDMSYMFNASKASYINISGFNTSKVITMHSMFRDSKATVIELGYLDTSNVTTMNSMFRDSSVLSLDISGWNTSKVTNMTYMFYNSKVIYADVSNFNVSLVKSMDYIFSKSVINIVDVSKWKFKSGVSKVGMYTGFKGTKIT